MRGDNTLVNAVYTVAIQFPVVTIKIMVLVLLHHVLWKGRYQCVEWYSCLHFHGTLLICSLVVVMFYHFSEIYCPYIQDTLAVEAGSSSEALVPIYQTTLTRCLMPDDCISKWECKVTKFQSKCSAVMWKSELHWSSSLWSFCECHQMCLKWKLHLHTI